MANINNLSSFLTDVADAIREKKGTQDQIPAENFDTEIKSIETSTGAKLFKTKAEMNNSTGNAEGDLAIVIYRNTLDGIYVYTNNNWKLAPTQLTATSGYVYKQLLFYGKNGIESGMLGIPDNSFADTTAKAVYEIQNQYENMEPRILTDTDKTIDKNIYFIPVKRNGTPLLDTSKVTNMEGMLRNCKNLTIIPELNTSNATNMNYMFMGCTNLTTIPLLDTSNVTDMHDMFENCTNLTVIPELNTSNVTYMNWMFSVCTNLTTIPLLDTSNVTNTYGMFNACENLMTIPLLDTSNVTTMNCMFQACLNLTTIPELNTSNVTKMYYMFNNCPNLTDDSLNIIMQMCINAVKITSNKTLKYIGLTSEQANKCKTLSNYSAFTSAGWTTGY